MAASPGTHFSEMTLANVASRAITGSTPRGCQERTGSISRSRPVMTPTSASGHRTTIAADIREFAEALVTLGDLRDSGLLTDVWRCLRGASRSETRMWSMTGLKGSSLDARGGYGARCPGHADASAACTVRQPTPW